MASVNVGNLLIKEKEHFNLPIAPELFVTSDLEHIVTEDDTPVDNLFSEKQQRLLVEPLYSSWRKAGRIFVAAANVGVFSSAHFPPVVPDMFLSMNVKVSEKNWWEKKNRSYFVWEFGKPPDVVIEIVSNKKGNEKGKKLLEYARIGVQYYVIYDPQRAIQNEDLQVFELKNGKYRLKDDYRLDKVGLTLILWEGIFEGDKQNEWLRWCDMEGKLIQSGLEWGVDGWKRAEQESERAEQESERAEQERERAEQERERAEQESERAEQESERAEQERERAEQERERVRKLIAQLRALGIEPE